MTVRSTALSRLPARPPVAAWVSSRLSRVAASIIIWSPGGPGGRGAKEGQRILRHLVEIGEQAARRAQGGAVEGAEAVEGGDLEPLLQPALGGKAVEPTLALGDGQVGDRLGGDDLGRSEPASSASSADGAIEPSSKRPVETSAAASP